MKLKKRLTQSLDILLALFPGAMALILIEYKISGIPLWLFAFSFVFILSGYPLASYLLPKRNYPEKIIGSAVISLFLTYPTAVLTILIEGQSAEAIYSKHLPTSFSILFLLSLLTAIFTIVKKKRNDFAGIRLNALSNRYFRYQSLVLAVMIYAFLVVFRLNRADVFGDEYDLGYQAYDLVDGIVAGRKAYFISTSGHPPLALTIKHFSMNMLNPNGLDSLTDWQFRFSEGVVGILTILATYVLAEKLFSKRVANYSALILAVNNYMVWMGRIFHREMYMTFFLVAGLLFYALAKKNRDRGFVYFTGISWGAALLVKETALIMLIIPLADLLLDKKQKIVSLGVIGLALLTFLPVIIYNILAFITTGYADVFFSNIFGVVRPGSTIIKINPTANIQSLFSYLNDIYSPIVFFFFLITAISAAFNKKIPRPLIYWLIGSLLFFSLTAIRAYYFLFLSVPLIIITASQVTHLKSRQRAIVLGLMILVSALYSFRTNHIRSFTIVDRIKPDGAVIVTHPIQQTFSFVARSWSEEVGYKRLQQILDKKIESDDCLIVSSLFDQLAARRYLGNNDGIKENYLGTEYDSRYPKCPQLIESVAGNVYLISSQEEGNMKLEEIITDHLGNKRFFLYHLDKESNI